MAVSLEKNTKLTKSALHAKAICRASQCDIDKGIVSEGYKVAFNKVMRKNGSNWEPTGIGVG